MVDFEVVAWLRKMTDTVIVSLSGGKDSVATLDLCHRSGLNVRMFHLYQVPGLRFQTDYLDALAEKYETGPCLMLPHPMRVDQMRTGYYCRPQPHLPRLEFNECWAAARRHFGCEWVASGEKKRDSLERRAQMVSWGNLQPARRRAFPLAEWSHKEVLEYLARQHIPLLPEYAVNDGNALNNLLRGRALTVVYRYWPEDYQRILKDFPLAEAARLRYEHLNPGDIRGKGKGNIAGQRGAG